MKGSGLIVGATLIATVLSACSESPSSLKSAPIRAALTITPSGTLDQSVLGILALYPKGLETAATTRWANIKSKYAAALLDPTQMPVAKQMLADLTDWITKKTPDMGTPPDGETKSAATARAALYMAMYVYNGPNTTPPVYTPAADAAVGLVTPTAAATVVTPTLHAGVQLEAGSVAENTIIVVTQNPTPYPDNCSGPLQTTLCQYPQFYTFEEFPHQRLLKPAKFNVCHINSGDARRPLADHDRFRLAHAKPSDPADYTPGSVIRDQNGESIEVLPLVAQTFSTCTNNAYVQLASTGGVTGALTRLATSIRGFFAPKTAYAIDLGLGGMSVSMSPFNDVDPLSQPDLIAQSVSSGAAYMLPGTATTVSYSVGNVGTATEDSTAVHVVLHYVGGDTPSAHPDRDVGFIVVPQLVPGSATSASPQITLPDDVTPGSYALTLHVDVNPKLPDTNLANNETSTGLTVAETWHVQESGGWHAVWTRRESGDALDGVWTSDDGTGRTTAVMSYSRNGTDVDFQRVSSSDGRLCHYVGTISSDRVSASGTETCPGINGAFAWTATLTSDPPIVIR
jgi:hypothetical protein